MSWENMAWFAGGNLQALLLFWGVIKIFRKYNFLPPVK
jgi:hypothetical protein